MADAGIVKMLSGTRREPVPGPKSSETFVNCSNTLSSLLAMQLESLTYEEEGTYSLVESEHTRRTLEFIRASSERDTSGL